MIARSTLARRRALPVLALVLVASLACAGPTGADPVTQSRSFDKSFTVTAGETLKLANLAGSVEIVPGSGDTLVVEATVHAAGRNDEETRRLLADMGWERASDGDGWALSYPVDRHRTFHYPQPSNRVIGFDFGSTNTRYQGTRVKVISRRSGSAPTLYVDLRISFPAGAGLALRNAVGRVAGGELAGDLSIDTGSGDVELAALSGELVVDTGSGDVEVGRLDGSGNLDTGSGDVVVGRADGDRLLIDTGSGDVRVGGGRLRELGVDTGSGDVEIADFDAERIVLDTGSGDVSIESPLNWARQVLVDTGSGDVEIFADPGASFRLSADQGSGDLDVRYSDARLILDGREVVGAERGDGHTRIEVDTGSGDCLLAPRG